MMIAHMAGISIFATGGIGGVHRGAEVTMDISADLEELGNTPVMVVCAGAKSILDLGLSPPVSSTTFASRNGVVSLPLMPFSAASFMA